MAKKRRTSGVRSEPVDLGPPERAQHNQVTVERDINNRARLRITDQLEIDRLLLKRLITMDQHTAGEHLYRLITAAGYFPPCRWLLDSGTSTASENEYSHSRSTALVKIGLSRVWLHAKAGEATTRFLWAVVLGERSVPDPLLPSIRHGLNTYQRFEAWWSGRDQQQSIPRLLADMPAGIQAHRPRSFHHEV